MNPPRTDTDAPVRHANTYSDVGDHVAFGVDPPCDLRFFFLSCRLLSPRLLDRRESASERIGFISRFGFRRRVVARYPEHRTNVEGR